MSYSPLDTVNSKMDTLLKKIKNLFRRRPPRTGIALGGGGARGLAHIGALQVMESHSVPIDFIVGTSMGAIVGAAYCQTSSAKEVLARAKNYFENRTHQERVLKKQLGLSPDSRLARWRKSFSHSYFLLRNSDREALVEEKLLRELVHGLVEEGEIEDTKVPFWAVAVDLLSGKENALTRGSVRRAARASASLPGIFPPVRVDGQLLVDGGVTKVLPVSYAAQWGADEVITVDVSKEIEESEAPAKGLDILFRVNAIARNRLTELDKSAASLIIRPEVDDYQWYEFSKYEEIIARGREAARRALER
ncbi:MAG: patatin-like phospholipase family protein [Candidatus Acetothermia bacterium]